MTKRSLTRMMDDAVRGPYKLTEKEKAQEHEEIEREFEKLNDKEKSVAFHYALYLAKNRLTPDPFLTSRE